MTTLALGAMDKIMRLNSVASTIENRFVYLPKQAEWLEVLPPRADDLSRQ